MLKDIFRKFIKQNNNASYYCNALAGNSSYNICINSDMSVSCNCQDWDGSGHIGDLTNSTFEEVFFGQKAKGFRESLLSGVFPLEVCKHCSELRKSTHEEACEVNKNSKIPFKGIMIENTVLCNFNCLFCNRKELMKVRNRYKMTLNDIDVIAQLLQKYNMQAISYFNLGETFLSEEIYDELKIIRAYNPNIEIKVSSNGVLIDTEVKREAALLLDFLSFSIDGPNQAIYEKYQVSGNFAKAIDNAKKLIDLRNSRGNVKPTIQWKYVVFNWNDSCEHIESAIELAKNVGFDVISFWLGGAPSQYMSQRYQSDPFFQQLGTISAKGAKEIYFRT